MTTKPNVKPDKASWAKRFRELFASHISALNTKVTPAQRATIRSAVVLEMELEVLSRRFAARQTGASAGDLALYAKISAAMQGLFESVGLGHQVSINHNVRIEDDGKAARDAIELALTKLITARQERERTSGIVIDVRPNNSESEPIASDRVDAAPARAEREPVRASRNVVRLRPPEASANHPKEPSSTELFYEHGNSNPTWGPIGSGGKPP